MAERHREAGRKGGQATAEKYGAEHMRKIGKRGFIATAEKLGDNGAAVSFLQKRGAMVKRPRGEWKCDPAWWVE